MSSLYEQSKNPEQGVTLAVVIPTFNESGHLPLTLAALVPAAVDGLVREVVISDGGSSDGTLEAADEAGAKIVTSANMALTDKNLRNG
jgi:glycosyltransferase involved in cell wall biosynthesis